VGERWVSKVLMWDISVVMSPVSSAVTKTVRSRGCEWGFVGGIAHAVCTRADARYLCKV